MNGRIPNIPYNRQRRFSAWMLIQLLLLLLSAENLQARDNAGKYVRVSIAGNQRTRTEVILRELSVRDGDTVSGERLHQLAALNYRRLYNLNLFSQIEVKVDSSRSDSCVLQIHLKEQWFLLPQADLQLADRNINVWWQEQGRDLGRINLGLYLHHKNLSGNMDRLTISMHAGYTQQLALNYSFPYLDKRQQHGIGFSAGYSRSRELAFATVANKLRFVHDTNRFIYENRFASASWIYRPHYAHRHILGVGFVQTNVEDTVLRLNPDYFQHGSRKLTYAELTYRWEFNGVDNWNYPREGFKIVGNAAFRKGWQGMQSLVIGNLEFGYFRRLNQRLLVSFIARGRTNFGSQQPYALSGGLGYRSNLVRGYEYYVVEAQHLGIGRVNLKYEWLKHRFRKTGIPYVPELPLWLYPKIFFDAGFAVNNYSGNGNNFSNRLLYAAGIGFDIITAYDLKLRIEFAWNHLGENGIYLHANSE